MGAIVLLCVTYADNTWYVLNVGVQTTGYYALDCDVRDKESKSKRKKSTPHTSHTWVHICGDDNFYIFERGTRRATSQRHV